MRQILLESGAWTALRKRPFGHIPLPDAQPTAIFVTAIDTDPLGFEPSVVLEQRRADFAYGLAVLGRLADCPLFVCTDETTNLPEFRNERIRQVVFTGPHPAGLPGTHIHFLAPVGLQREVWHIGFQDVLAIGRLFVTGNVCSERVVALGGPLVREPRLLRTSLGAQLETLLAGELEPGQRRVISGSVLSGRRALGACGFLGRYHQQIAVMSDVGVRRPERRLRRLNLFSSWSPPSVLSRPHEQTSVVYPINRYERVMPLDVPTVPLLRALASGDVERALALGCLELEEDDLALCAFVCPGKGDYGKLLRQSLAVIEEEG